MIKFLADENIGRSTVKFLRKSDFDVLWVLEEYAGSADVELLQRANLQRRILLTSDKDFGYLAFAEKLPHAGIILLRLKSKSPLTQVDVVAKLLSLRYKNKLTNNFVVATETKVRIRASQPR